MRNALVLVLLTAGLAHGGPTIDPPPGWRDVTSEGKARNAVIALKGPETSSFLVKAAPLAPMDNPAGVRGYLHDVLTGLRSSTGLDFRTTGRVETRVFRNGLKAQLLRAALAGEERVVIGLFSVNNAPHLAVLLSAAPEAMLDSLLGALKVGKLEGAIQSRGVARSSDGQLELALGGGLRARALLDAEAGKGFVLVIQGSGSEIIFQKLAEADATKPAEQAAIVRALTASSAGVPATKVAPIVEAATPAGPVGILSWATSANGEKLSVGYLPWGYWGYQLFGRGPAADELMTGVLAALKAGPTAVPGLLASTPRIPIKKGASPRALALGVLATLTAGILLIWSLRRKKR